MSQKSKPPRRFLISFTYPVFRDIKRLSAMAHLSPNQFIRNAIPLLERELIKEAKEMSDFIKTNCVGDNIYSEGLLLEGDVLKLRIIEARVKEQLEERRAKKYNEERQALIANTMEKIGEAKEADNKVIELRRNINKMDTV